LGGQGTTIDSGALGRLLPHALEATRFTTYVPLETAPLSARPLVWKLPVKRPVTLSV
jgi:hypothetical protein